MIGRVKNWIFQPSTLWIRALSKGFKFLQFFFVDFLDYLLPDLDSVGLFSRLFNETHFLNLNSKYAVSLKAILVALNLNNTEKPHSYGIAKGQVWIITFELSQKITDKSLIAWISYMRACWKRMLTFIALVIENGQLWRTSIHEKGNTFKFRGKFR